MPHVIVKLWPGKSDDQKRRLTETITKGVMETLEYGEEAVSVGFEEVAPADWTAKVYEPDIAAKWNTLTKQPGYGDRPTVGPERIAVTGPNGFGKSTLLRTVAGDLPLLGGTMPRGGAGSIRRGVAGGQPRRGVPR